MSAAVAQPEGAGRPVAGFLAPGRLGFGGAALANLFAPVAEEDAMAAVAAALACGVRHLDTAPYYGYGLSEARLGRALAQVPHTGVTVSTKVGYVLDPQLAREAGPLFVGDVPDLGVGFDYGRASVHRSLEHSLARLGLARVGALLVHDLDPTVHRDDAAFERHVEVAMAEGWPVLRELRRDGLTDAIGFGLNHVGAARRLIASSDPDLLLLAGRYTLLDHEEALPLLEACARRGIAVMIGGPFNSGILASGTGPGAMYDYAPPDGFVRDRVAALEQACARHGVPLAAAALWFAFGQPAVVKVIPGMRSAAEVARNAALLERRPPAALWDELRERGLIAAGAPTP